MNEAMMESIKSQVAVGNLILNSRRIPVRLTHASKYSLHVSFLNGDDFINGTEFESLVIDPDPKSEPFEFGKCHLLSEANIDGHAGRLVFKDDIYNFDMFFAKKLTVNLDTFFYNLPLILTHKNNVMQSFKDFTSNLSYDLSVYKQYFDNMDAEYQQEPPEIAGEIRNIIIGSEGRKYMAFLDTKLEELESQIKDFTREEHERHGFYFRKQIWNFIMCSEFMARTNTKPRGYAGDSEMMQMIYENDYRGPSTFAMLMHKHPLEHPAAQAVRNRRTLITGTLKQIRDSFSGLPRQGFKLLSVACGPAAELNDILVTEEDFNKFNFTLFDQDRIALMAAAKGVDDMEKRVKTKLKVNYLKDSVRTMLSTSRITEKWGQFHYIYSMGLFDYLTPPVAMMVMKKLYELLLPGGTLLIGNFHVSNPSRFYMEYWCDWSLYYRTEQDMLDLIQDDTAEKSVTFENSGSQMFLKVRKAP